MNIIPDQFSAPSPSQAGLVDDVTYLRLIRSRRVGPATFHRLITEYGTATAALEALPEIAAEAGVTDYNICPEAVVLAELKAGHKAKAKLLRYDSPDYPALLRLIDDAPPVLWVQGQIGMLSYNPIAVIGARNASSLGLRMARGMAAGLGKIGHCVVSGLARGIDTAAHEAALQTGTVAVLAGGLNAIYPSENIRLAGEIAEKGVLVSEHPLDLSPMARHFPARNRIISGMSHAVVVVEAAHRSGSLLTAKHALDQGRDVMAVPGHPMDTRAGGCNHLIRDGALLVRSAADVVEVMTKKPDTPHQQAHMQKAPAAGNGTPQQIESKILSRLSPSPSEENELIRDLGLSPAACNAAIQSLELQGRVIRLAGGLLAAGSEGLGRTDH